jgi:hypothetical protein
VLPGGLGFEGRCRRGLGAQGLCSSPYACVGHAAGQRVVSTARTSTDAAVGAAMAVRAVMPMARTSNLADQERLSGAPVRTATTTSWIA